MRKRLWPSRFEFSFQDLVDESGVGLAPGQLHRLSDEESEHLLGAAEVFLDLDLPGGEHPVNGLLDRSGIGDLGQPLAPDELRQDLPAR